MTRTVPVTGNFVINVLGVKAFRAVVGVAGADGFGFAVVTDEVFFDLDEVFGHGLIVIGERIIDKY